MKFQLNKRGAWLTIILTVLLVLGSAYLSTQVKTNYDLTKYLPQDSNTAQGLDILEQEFSNDATVQLMISDVSAADVLRLKAKLSPIEGVLSVVWIDDVIDISTVPIDLIPPEYKDKFYKNNNALINITFTEDSYNVSLEDSVKEIRTVLSDYDYSIRGELLTNIQSRNVANQETFKIMFIILPVCIFILLFASRSFIEPILILITLGVGIVLNLGTNAFLSDISFITMTMALALQLAMSLDYALFMIHRYYEYVEKDYSKVDAILMAFKKSLGVISASAMTTIAGFVALFFMSYKIGFDVGIVLSKGILLSYLATIFLMPVLLFLFDDLLKKTKHRSFMPKFRKIGHYVYKARYYIVLIFIVSLGVFAFHSTKVEYLYGNTANNGETQLYKDEQKISEVFGSFNPVVVLVKNQTVADEYLLVQNLMNIEHVSEVLSLVTSTQPGQDRVDVDPNIVGQFLTENYSRFIIYTDIKEESELMFTFTDTLREKTSAIYDDYYFVGLATSTADIKESVDKDSLFILIYSALSVGLVIGLLFKSILIPIILVLTIEFAIFFNLSILFYTGTPMLYIGYLVVMSIQLGATIDYAVLLASRYMDNRKEMSVHDSITRAYKNSLPSILVSMTVLFAAGLVEGLFSDIEAIQSIGLFLAKGTIISFLSVVIFTGPLLILFDKIIVRKQKEKSISA